MQSAKAKSGAAVVLDSRTGELLALADYPTFDANQPGKAPKADLGSSALSDVYEPGSVEKVLTASSLLDAGKVTPRTRIKVPVRAAGARPRRSATGSTTALIRLTMAGVIARSSNIGTALAADAVHARAAAGPTSTSSASGRRTDVGMPGETRGVLPHRATSGRR